jgi:hypothetical protein
VLVPVLVLAAYWFLLLAPKREEASKATTDLAAEQQRLAQARDRAAMANGDKTDFAADYGEIVRLGKAIPAKVDMPSLLVQLDRAAEGTGITFTKISQGDREAVAPAAPAATTPPADGTTPAAPAAPGTTPAAAGGAPTQSAPGQATESANNAAAASNQQAAAAEQTGVDATTSTTASPGGLPVGGGTVAGAEAAAPGPVGLETVPLTLEFEGNFFSLADFFHDIKRFVHVAEDSVTVNGRLVTIEGVNFSSDTTIFPKIKAELTATVYLSPAVEGTTAGATPAGPAPATTPAAAPAPTPAPTPTPAPVAAATPR